MTIQRNQPRSLFETKENTHVHSISEIFELICSFPAGLLILPLALDHVREARLLTEMIINACKQAYMHLKGPRLRQE